MIDYLTLFLSAFLSATVLPFYSEYILFTLIQDGSVWLPVMIATTGNTLGSLINWWLGTKLLTFQSKRWFYFSENQIQHGQRWFGRYGTWSLLLSWAPIFGDAITLVAGVMKVRLSIFILLVSVGKCLRYAVVASIATTV